METRTYRIPGHTMLEHTFEAPLDHFASVESEPRDHANSANSQEKITVFAREYVRDGNENLPRLVFFQGGPGSAGPRMAPIGSWLETALNYFRVVLLDERGTGRSTPLEAQAVTARGDSAAQAAYLSHFLQDNIVADAEVLRKNLQDDRPWATLGQSFGGFCVTRYLSAHPEGLSEAYITAGLPSLTAHPDTVYEKTYIEVRKRTKEFFARYPEDENTAWDIVCHLAECEEIMPNGEHLTPGRFRQIGISLGASYGLEQLHFLLEDPFWHLAGTRRLRPRFLDAICQQLSYASHPLYGIIHEAIYGQASTGATAWSAQRVRESLPDFRLPDIADGARGEAALRTEGYGFRFTGEHIYPFQVASDPALSPMCKAADLLAEKNDWPQLYSPEALAQCTVPAAAWMYVDDVYVPFDISRESAAAIPSLQPLISNEYHHDGLRTGGPIMIEKLVAAVRSR